MMPFLERTILRFLKVPLFINVKFVDITALSFWRSHVVRPLHAKDLHFSFWGLFVFHLEVLELWFEFYLCFISKGSVPPELLLTDEKGLDGFPYFGLCLSLKDVYCCLIYMIMKRVG